jgi:membrane-bound lytic murein transglycosylase A
MSIGYSLIKSDMAAPIENKHCMSVAGRIPASIFKSISAFGAEFAPDSTLIRAFGAGHQVSQQAAGRRRGWGAGRIGAWLGAASLAVLLAACGGRSYVRAPAPTGAPNLPPQIASQRLTPVAWQQVPGWQDDSLIGVTAALRANCTRLANDPRWQRACAAASQLDDLDSTSARSFFETYFTPYQFANSDGTLDGLVTGYYEPLLHGSRTRHGVYQTALYRWPAGYRAGTALPPRAQLERSGVLNGNELVWVDDPIEAFFRRCRAPGAFRWKTAA